MSDAMPSASQAPDVSPPAGGATPDRTLLPATLEVAPRGRTRQEVLQGLLARRTVSQLARNLSITRRAVQKHRDALLLAGAIIEAGATPSLRFEKGPRYELVMAVEGGATPTALPAIARPQQVAPPFVVTDGARTFRVLVPPAAAERVPGFVRTTLTGRGAPQKKRRDHLVAWTNQGRTFDLVLQHYPQTDGWSLVVKKVRPPPYLAALQAAPGEDKEQAWDRFVAGAMELWSAAAGVRLNLEVRRSRPVAATLENVMPNGVKFRAPGVEADDTPTPRTLEAMTAEYQEAIAALPEDRRSFAASILDHDRALRFIAVRLEAHDHVLARAAAAAEATEKAVEHLTRGQVAVVKALDGLASASTSPPPSNVSGVEYQ